MATLSELNKQQKEIIDQIFWSEQSESDDELQSLDQLLSQITGEAEQIIGFMDGLLAELELIESARKTILDREKVRHDRARKAALDMRSRIKSRMDEFGIQSMKSSHGALRIQRGREKVLLDDEITCNPKVMHKDFREKKVTYVIDTKGIMEHLKSGNQLDHCSLGPGDSFIVIRR